MVSLIHLYAAVLASSTSLVSAHISIFHPAMWGFNKTDTNRPQDPLINLPFDQWWFHGHLGYPPHPNDIMQLPVGQKAMTELSCDKDATSYWTSGPGGNQQDPNNPDYPCPGQPTTQFHTNGIDDLGGCALAVAYKSDVNEVQPEDFVVFSVNQTCVWNLHTYFEVPAEMPPCPNNKCTCAWFWTHRADSGSEQNYMTGFQCNFANTQSTKKLATPNVPRRCGPEQSNNYQWNYGNCTYGAKQPFYWYQQERNNMQEGTYTPPLYRDLYNFHDGAQNDIFENTTDTGPSSALPASTSGSANAVQPSSSPSPNSSSAAPAQSPSHVLMQAVVPHTQAKDAKPTTGGQNHQNHQINHGPGRHHHHDNHDNHPCSHHHGHSGQPECSGHHKGQHHKSHRSGHHALRNEWPVEDLALRRAWGAHHRRSVSD